ncbi:hypothetical protein [Rivibacter subsaxonicus]|uniref:DUF2570 family protein n=1 Tax=Rivibacter subsaxonicus TaxID=457575 RepID=A0A4Q7VGB9_9BURK|nr:hypothetical protein [Rivibacter subsaxonicus]RZT95071.1 hypothetical protein EV670_2819 [Rivibacter subsaxonicus]
MTNLLFWLLPVFTAMAAAVLAWWSTSRWYMRQLLALQGKVERTKEQATIRLKQARRQVGQLQEELARRPPLSNEQREERDASAEAAAQRVALEAGLIAGDSRTREIAAFADTQPIMPHVH